MPPDALFTDTTIAALTKGLQATALQQQAIAGNIANAETPGYRATRVTFEDALRRALAAPERGRAEAVARVTPQTSAHAGAPLRRDGSTVDLEAELSALGESGLRYRTMARLLKAKLQMLREAMPGSGQR